MTENVTGITQGGKKNDYWNYNREKNNSSMTYWHSIYATFTKGHNWGTVSKEIQKALSIQTWAL